MNRLLILLFAALLWAMAPALMAQDKHDHGKHAQPSDPKEKDKHEGHDHGEHGENEEANHEEDEADHEEADADGHEGHDHDDHAEDEEEGIIEITPEAVKMAGIELADVARGTIGKYIDLPGEVGFNEDRLAHIAPRFAGITKEARFRVGDYVTKGDVVAVIESNESLHPYELRAPQTGTVIDKSVAPGEFVSNERELFAIADLSTVWADLDVYRRDVGRLRVGQQVRADAGDGAAPTGSTLSYLSPIGSVNTQTLLARAVLPNPDGSWRPGLFLSAEVEVASFEAPVAVVEASVQRLGDWDVVFVAEGGVFEAQPVVLGRTDGSHVEVVGGLAAGQRYAAAGSFVLKAEAGKSGASHDH